MRTTYPVLVGYIAWTDLQEVAVCDLIAPSNGHPHFIVFDPRNDAAARYPVDPGSTPADVLLRHGWALIRPFELIVGTDPAEYAADVAEAPFLVLDADVDGGGRP